MKNALKVLLVLFFASFQSHIINAGTPPPVPSQEEPEVLNQGPMHEAFAQPVDINPDPGLVAPNEPPPAIIENPSAERPKSADYVWIPGYWGWDPENQQYVWVSGCWRNSTREYVLGAWILEQS